MTNGSCPREKTRTAIFVAIDSCNNSDTLTKIVIISDTTPPELFCPRDTIINEDSPLDTMALGSASAMDACAVSGDGIMQLTFSDIFRLGFQFDTLVRTWMAMDSCSNIAECAQTILIAKDLPMGIICPADITVECKSESNPNNTGYAMFSDSTEPDTIYYNDLIIENGCSDTLFRTWIAMDSAGMMDTCVQAIIISDKIAPMFTISDSIYNIDCASDIPDLPIIDLTDNCGITNIDSLIVISDSTCANAFSRTATFIATDSCGNVDTLTQIVIVSETISPIVVCPPDMTIDCSASTDTSATGVASAIPGCDNTISSISYSDSVYTGSLVAFGYAVRWTSWC